jgi:hypothetical protein
MKVSRHGIFEGIIPVFCSEDEGIHYSLVRVATKLAEV